MPNCHVCLCILYAKFFVLNSQFITVVQTFSIDIFALVKSEKNAIFTVDVTRFCQALTITSINDRMI